MSGASSADADVLQGGRLPDLTSSPPPSTSASAAKHSSDEEVNAVHTTPTEQRRKRKSFTEDEKRDFWRQKKQEKKTRKKAAAAERLKEQQAEWARLTDAEKAARRAEAAEVHERRRCAEAAITQRCESQLADAKVPVLVFDLSFAWCMTVPDTKSTVSQVKFSYSSLRSAGFPFRPVISSLIGKERADTEHDAADQCEVLQALRDFEGFRRFPPQVLEDAHWSEHFSPEKVVFLTADAADVLTTVEPDTAYVIGAFVDHNKYKGMSYAAAQRHRVRSARLPIKESVDLGNRCKVLTINHVVDVLIRFEALRASGTPDWSRAIDEALPTRRTHQMEQEGRKRCRLSARGSDCETEGSRGEEEEPE